MLFYKNIQSSVVKNGVVTDYFSLKHGVTHGDPLSPNKKVVRGACFLPLLQGGIWLGCQDLPAKGTSGCPQAPNLHITVTQL